LDCRAASICNGFSRSVTRLDLGGRWRSDPRSEAGRGSPGRRCESRPSCSRETDGAPAWHTGDGRRTKHPQKTLSAPTLGSQLGISSPPCDLATHVSGVAISARQQTQKWPRTGRNGPRKRVRVHASALGAVQHRRLTRLPQRCAQVDPTWNEHPLRSLSGLTGRLAHRFSLPIWVGMWGLEGLAHHRVPLTGQDRPIARRPHSASQSILFGVFLCELPNLTWECQQAVWVADRSSLTPRRPKL
jgi:hypothetical protein